jgi:hypothetical protein
MSEEKKQKSQTFVEAMTEINWGGRTEYRDGKAIKVPNEPLDPNKREIQLKIRLLLRGTSKKPANGLRLLHRRVDE